MYNVSTKKQIYILIFLYFLCFIGFSTAYLIKKYNKKYDKAVDRYNQLCMYYNKSEIIQKLTKHRGIQYYFNGHLDDMDEKKTILYKRKYCVVTFWSMSHIILYALIGFFCPSLFLLTFALGVIWEGVEKKFCNCHDLIDIIYNSLGFGIGYMINKICFNKFSSNVKIISIVVILIVLLLILDFINKIEDFSNNLFSKFSKFSNINEKDKQDKQKSMMIFKDIDKNEIDSSITDNMIKYEYD
jgi:glycopeptide antibiotics resistance protein